MSKNLLDRIPLIQSRPTIDAFRDHGLPENRLEQKPEQPLTILEAIGRLGIYMDEVALQLEKEGIAKFETPYKKLLSSIKEKIKQ